MLEIGRALLLAPELILIDEPCPESDRPSVRDAHRIAPGRCHGFDGQAERAECAGDIGRRNRSEQGRLALAGSADEILSDGRVDALFLGGGLGSGKKPPL